MLLANLENPAGATGLEKVSFLPNPKERQCQSMFKLCTIALISHASKRTFKILQARLQQYVNWELPDVQAGFRKGRGTRDRISIIEKARESRKTSTSASLMTLKLLTMWITTKWKSLQEMGIPDHLTCLLRNLFADQEATIGTRHGPTDWFLIGKGVHQGCILSPCLFKLCRVHHEKHWAGWSRRWNQDCQEKYQ